jgi:hypothetical protein
MQHKHPSSQLRGRGRQRGWAQECVVVVVVTLGRTMIQQLVVNQ